MADLLLEHALRDLLFRCCCKPLCSGCHHRVTQSQYRMYKIHGSQESSAGTAKHKVIACSALNQVRLPVHNCIGPRTLLTSSLSLSPTDTQCQESSQRTLDDIFKDQNTGSALPACIIASRIQPSLEHFSCCRTPKLTKTPLQQVTRLGGLAEHLVSWLTCSRGFGPFGVLQHVNCSAVRELLK